MKQKITLAITAIALTGATLNAQTIATFDDLTLPSNDTSYLETFTTDGEYPFASGNISLIGKIDYGGSYQTWFNYSNRTDDSTNSWTNQWSAITASGVNNSDNYGIAYLEWNDPESSLEMGIKLTNDAIGEYVLGTYVTNTTWAYLYMEDNYSNSDYLQLVFRGYDNNTFTDSVVFDLAANGQWINTWEWVDLTILGKVDSITMQLYTADDMTPFYIAFDDFTTSDGICPTVTNLAVDNITETSATITWDNNGGSFTSRYEVVIDRTATLAPLDTTLLNPSIQPEYEATLLNKGTTYYAHIRAFCQGDVVSAWDTVSFKTLGTSSIGNLNNNFNVIVTPNPAKESVNFLNIEAATITVFSIEGRVMEQYTNTNSIIINQYPSGVYFAKILDKNGNNTMVKFIKE